MSAEQTAILSPAWRDVPGYEGCYQVTIDGRVRGPRKELRLLPTGTGRWSSVNLYKDGHRSHVTVATIVGMTFGSAAVKAYRSRFPRLSRDKHRAAYTRVKCSI